MKITEAADNVEIDCRRGGWRIDNRTDIRDCTLILASRERSNSTGRERSNLAVTIIANVVTRNVKEVVGTIACTDTNDCQTLRQFDDLDELLKALRAR